MSNSPALADVSYIAGTDKPVSFWHLVTSMTGCYALALMTASIIPMYVLAYQGGWGLDEAASNNIAGYEVMTLAVVVFLTAPFIKRLNPGNLAFAGGLIFLLVQWMSISAEADMLSSWRMLGGVGSGLMLAAANAVFSRYHDTETLIGATLAVNTLLMVIIQYAGGYVLGMEPKYFFYLTGGLAIICLPFVLRLPNLAIPVSEFHGEKTNSLRPKLLLIILLFVAAFLGMAAEYGIWSLSSIVSTSKLGMSVESYGALAAGTSIAVLAGNILVALVGHKYKRTLPVAISLSAIGVLGYLVFTTDSIAVFQGSLLLHNLALGIFMPLSIAVSANLDVEGRVANWANTLVLFAGGVGPIFAAGMLQESGYDYTATTLLIMVLVSVALFLPVVREEDKSFNN